MAFHKKNLILTNTLIEEHTYTSDGSIVHGNYKDRERQSHGQYLLRQLDNVWKTEEQRKAMFATIKDRHGTYIEVKGAENCDLLFNSLDNTTEGIEFLKLRNEESADGSVSVQSATVFIPEGKELFFNKKIQQYLNENSKWEKPKNKKLVESIETIQLAAMSSFWTGDLKDLPTQNEAWCEFWIRTDVTQEKETAETFFNICDENQICYKKRIIIFPEKVIVLVKVNKEKIQKLLNSVGRITEVRRAPETAKFFTCLTSSEARKWVDDLKQRIKIQNPMSYICILDTGVNNGHPLLSDVLDSKRIEAVDSAWNKYDSQGHGTQMAGICEYFELESLLAESSEISLYHQLELVKILPDYGNKNDPELYGAITSDATSITEINNPNVKRVFCMAVTADKYALKDGSPSSWSAELDKIISGVDDGIRKLFVVSAGNVEINEIEQFSYTDANIYHSVEDPGQSWNALTIGAYTSKVKIDDPSLSGWSPIADAGELSPFSSTSMDWDSKWPIKPEVLFEGGNAITDSKNVDICDDVSLLTTSKSPMVRLFDTINATSAATAQAANVAARLMAAYPELWEETIRGLIVHSAEWTEKMREQFCKDDKKTTGRRELLHACGYGVADFTRAAESLNNNVNMIIQEELQPYQKVAGRYKTKDMHLHKIPWPKEVLQELGETTVRMKVTLSYYIEPAPEQKGWNNKYRYASSALRFEVINKNQTKDDFLKRINAEAREDEKKKDKGEGTAGSERWFLGKDNRDVGSIHSDTWTGMAVDLAESDYIAVYPVIGWWRERHNLNKYNEKIRYSLIVSIETKEEDIDFYTPIETQIQNMIQTTVEV